MGNGGAVVADEASSIADETLQKVGSDSSELDDSSIVNEAGQGKSRVEKPDRRKSKRKKSAHFKNRSKKVAHNKRKSLNTKHSSKLSANGEMKKREKKKNGRNLKHGSIKWDFEKAKEMLYDNIDVKRDDISRLEPDEYEEGTLRDKTASYSPDDEDITKIVSRFTDQKHEDSHRMGKDELQMHLDDEALKMEVKAIEEEDSNVKNVLQGSEKFANEQRLGRFEGDYEKDLIKKIGKDGLELGAGTFGKRRHGEGRDSDRDFAEVDDKRKEADYDKEDENDGDDREEDKERFDSKDKEEEENEDNGEDHDEERKDSKGRKWSEDEDKDEDKDEERNEDRNGDEQGERKDTVREGSSEEGGRNLKRTRSRAKKYNFFNPTAKLGSDITPTDEADMGVNIDNQAMESEIKAIENEDAKVSSALEGNSKSPQKIELDEYNYDSSDGVAGMKFTHHKFGVELNDEGNSDDRADQKHGISQGDTVKGNAPISDDIKDMLRETSKILNETNAVLNEGRAVAHKSHEVIDLAHHEKDNAKNETNALPHGANVVPHETNVKPKEADTRSKDLNYTLESTTVGNEIPGGNGAPKNETIKTANATQNLVANQSKTSEGKNITENNSAASVESSAVSSSDEFILKGQPITASKRVLKRNDEDQLKPKHSSRKKHGRSALRPAEGKRRRRRKQKLQSFFDENESAVQHSSKQKYTQTEMKILNLMYKSPIFKSVRGKIATLHRSLADKRSYTPKVKTTYRRFKRPRMLRRKGQLSKKRITEIGKKRGDVESGMTGGKLI